MILLKSLKLHNFLSHEESNIEFQENGKVLIDGVSGSGKSSIIEALVWCLYGKARTDNRSLVRRGAERSSVVLNLVQDDGKGARSDICITRSITSAGKHGLTVTVDGTAHELYNLRDLQSWIEKELIGASYLLFVNSVAYLQNSGDLFVLQSAAKRKELLLEIVNVENFDALADKSRKVQEDIDLKITTADNELVQIGRWRAEAKTHIDLKPSMEQELISVRKQMETEEDAKEVVNKDLGAYNLQAAAVESLRAVVVSKSKDKESLERKWLAACVARTELTALEAPKTTLSEIDTAIAAIESDMSKAAELDARRERLLRSKPVVRDHKWDIENLQKGIDDYLALDTCPSGDQCPHQAENFRRIETYRKEIGVHEIALRTETTALETWQRSIDGLPSTDMGALVKTLSSLRTTRDEILRFEEKKRSLSESASKEPELHSELTSLLVDLEDAQRRFLATDKDTDTKAKDALDNKLKTIIASIRTSREREAHLTGEIKYIEKLEGAVPAHVAQEQNLAEEKNSLQIKATKVSALRTALGSKGLKQVVIDYLLPRLEEKINEVLAQMSDFRIHLDTQKPTVDGEGVTEGLFITIINDLGEEMAWENYSGGERLKITVAISEALASLQKVGFRIFDETFVGLDDNSTEDFAGVVGRLQKRFPQVLMISHLTAVKGMFDNVLTINKTDGKSHVRTGISTGDA